MSARSLTSMHLEPATPAQFIESPVGRYVATDCTFFACVDEGLHVLSAWGRPNVHSVQLIGQLVFGEHYQRLAPHASLFDFERVDGWCPAVFSATHEMLLRHRAAMARKVTRQAIVHPMGLTGAAVAGYLRLYPPPFATDHFNGLLDAVQWLSVPDPHGVLGALTALRTELSDTPQLNALRAELKRLGPAATLETAARSMGLTARTLQRRLAAAGTSFHRVRSELRLQEAQRMLEDTNDKITSIASALGFSTHQHLSHLFRRWTGKTPSEWREAM
jgi:AraC-like DNA-binding protein